MKQSLILAQVVKKFYEFNWTRRFVTTFTTAYRRSVFRDQFSLQPHSFIHSVVCLTTGPQRLPKRVLHGVIYSASLFSFQYSLVSWRSFSGCLSLLPRRPVTSLPSIFPSVTCHMAVCRIYLSSLTL